ncbi:MAG: hypothetical protein JXR11_02595 [Balneola sp.]
MGNKPSFEEEFRKSALLIRGFINIVYKHQSKTHKWSESFGGLKQEFDMAIKFFERNDFNFEEILSEIADPSFDELMETYANESEYKHLSKEEINKMKKDLKNDVNDFFESSFNFGTPR